MLQTTASREELAAETSTTLGLTGAWVKALRSSSPWPVPQSSGLHNRGTASQSPGRQPGKQQGEHLHSPSAAYSTKLFKPHSILPHLSVLPIQTVQLRSRSYSNTHGIRQALQTLTLRQTPVFRDTQGALHPQLLRHCLYGLTSPSTFTCHMYARSLSQVPVTALNSFACTVQRTGMRTWASLPPAFGHIHLRYPEH